MLKTTLPAYSLYIISLYLRHVKPNPQLMKAMPPFMKYYVLHDILTSLTKKTSITSHY